MFTAEIFTSKLFMGKVKDEKDHWLDENFPRYTDYHPEVPVWCVTPEINRCISRFHLSSPVSPSGRYLALTRLSREDRRPDPGEVAEIILVDLEKGGAKIIAETWECF